LNLSRKPPIPPGLERVAAFFGARQRVNSVRPERTGYRRALVAHHNLATLSDEVIGEYDFRECPVCKRAREEP
jgi:hypothetical protein